MSGSISLDENRLSRAFLRVDSDLRNLILSEVRDRLIASLIEVPDDRYTHLIIAGFADQIEGRDDLLDALSAYFSNVEGRHIEFSPLSKRLIEAREIYERFFDAKPAWRVPGWSDELIMLASDLYVRSDIEIAVTIWHFDRANAEAQALDSIAQAPQLEFDHRILGSGRYVILSDQLNSFEPFFATEFPVVGVCGVTDAWMYLAQELVDQFGQEIASYMAAEMPEAAQFLADVDQSIEERPLGVDSTELAAEAFVRHLTITEAAESVFDRLMRKLVESETTDTSVRQEDSLTRYVRIVLEVGSLCRPVLFDSSSAKTHADNLLARLRDSFLRRESVFMAWNRYVDYAKTSGVWVREYSLECAEIRSLFEAQCPGAFFTADFLRMTISSLALHQNFSPSKIVNELLDHRRSLANESPDPDERTIRVFGPDSPAIVLKKT